MCIIAAIPAGERVTRRIAKECFDFNSDGAGIAWADGEKVQVAKGFFDFRPFWKKLQEVQEQYPVLMHCRTTTHGKTNKTNCHPFTVAPGAMVMAHNGIINGLPVSAELSDTQIFLQQYVLPLAEQFGWDAIRHPSVLRVFERIIGAGSKLAFLDKNGDFHFVNKAAGVIDENIWYSNMSYLPMCSYYSPAARLGWGGNYIDEDDYSTRYTTKPHKSRNEIIELMTDTEYKILLQLEETWGTTLLGKDIEDMRLCDALLEV